MNSQLQDWVRLIRGEYLEIPGLNLTKRQVQRLWGLDAATCDEVLALLEGAHFLRRTEHEQYVLTDGTAHVPDDRPVSAA